MEVKCRVDRRRPACRLDLAHAVVLALLVSQTATAQVVAQHATAGRERSEAQSGARRPPRLTCGQLGWPSSGGICADSEVAGACYAGAAGVSQARADELCAGIGARLCTVSELETDVARGTGCMIDFESVWTADRCSSDQTYHVRSRGSTKGTSPSNGGCDGVTDASKASVRCCADVIVTTTPVPVTETVPVESEFTDAVSSAAAPSSRSTSRQPLATVTASTALAIEYSMHSGCCRTAGGGTGVILRQESRSLSACESLCSLEPRCVAFEHLGTTCEIHVEHITHTAPVPGCRCHTRIAAAEESGSVVTTVTSPPATTAPQGSCGVAFTWTSGPSLPDDLGEVAAAAVGSRVFLFGQSRTSAGSPTYALDLTTQRWISGLSPRPYSGNHHAAVAIAESVYIVGGLGGGSGGKLQVYDTRANIWSIGPNLPWHTEGSLAAVTMGGLIYACGGLYAPHQNNPSDCFRYDPSSAEWVRFASMLQGVDHAAAGATADEMFVFGGRSEGRNWVDAGLALCQRYSRISNTWSYCRSMPFGRAGMGFAPFLGGNFYVFGGETNQADAHTSTGNVYRHVSAYSVEEDRWDHVADLPTPKHGVYPIIVHGQQVLLAGGGTRAGYGMSSSVHFMCLPPAISTTTQSPTDLPSVAPTTPPSQPPTALPSAVPTLLPTLNPSLNPTPMPSSAPSHAPSEVTDGPSEAPIASPSSSPTLIPSHIPSASPSSMLPFSTISGPTVPPSSALSHEHILDAQTTHISTQSQVPTCSGGEVDPIVCIESFARGGCDLPVMRAFCPAHCGTCGTEQVRCSTGTPTAPLPAAETPITSAPTAATPTIIPPTITTPSTVISTTATPTTAAPAITTPATATPTTMAPTTATPTTPAPTTTAPTTLAPTVITYELLPGCCRTNGGGFGTFTLLQSGSSACEQACTDDLLCVAYEQMGTACEIHSETVTHAAPVSDCSCYIKNSVSATTLPPAIETVPRTSYGSLSGSTSVTFGTAEDLGPLPSAHIAAESQGAALNSKIYYFGGFDLAWSAMSKTSHAWDTLSGTWSRLPDIPLPGSATGITHTGNVVWTDESSIILVGGIGNGFTHDTPAWPASTSRAEVYSFSTITNTWLHLPDLPQDRGALAAAIVGNTLYAFGGGSYGRLSRGGSFGFIVDHTDTWALDLRNTANGWVPRASMGIARNHLGGATSNGKVFAIGGQELELEGCTAKNVVEMYDPATDTWTQVQSLPRPLGHITPSTLGATSGFSYGMLIVSGASMGSGCAPPGFHQPIATYWNPVTAVWQEIDFPVAGASMVTGLINGYIYVIKREPQRLYRVQLTVNL